MAGSGAIKKTWPLIAEWLAQRSDGLKRET
jgi:hypothetical protein